MTKSERETNSSGQGTPTLMQLSRRSQIAFPRLVAVRGGLFVCFVLLTCLSAVGSPRPDGPARERFDVWTTENGLPQNSVNAIVQTRDGYLWLATMDGLARFDGVRFTVFSRANTPGMRSNRLTALCEDGEGSLWIGTEDGGVIRYKDRAFKTYTTEDGLPTDQVYEIHVARESILFVRTVKGVARWDGGRFLPYSAGEARFAHLKDGPLAIDDEGGLWATDTSGFYRWTPDGGLANYPVKGGLPGGLFIHATYRDRRGAIWLGTAEAGVFKLQDGELVRPGKDLSTGSINSLCGDRDGQMWLAADKGLLRYANGAVTSYTTTQGLSNSSLLSVYQDREGNLWIGTAQGGLNVLRKKAVTVLSTEDGLSANNVYPILEDRDGSVWVGAWPGLNRYKDGKFTAIVMPDGSPYDRPSALFQDSEGHLWVGSYGGGALRLEGSGYPTVKAEVVLSDGVVVHAIQQDRAGAMWFGTAAGLIKLENGVFTVSTVQEGLPNNRVTALRETRDGALWCGTRAGLARLKDGRFTTFTETQGLSGEHVRAIYEDSEGVLWVGTYDGGLTRIKDGAFTKYTTKDGLFDYGVFQILEDARGDFWISCNRGIYRVSRRELNEFAEGRVNSITAVEYGKRDGLVNIECNGGNQPAGIKTHDGRLWFPTQGGVAIIDPERVEKSLQQPPVLVEQVVVNNAPSVFRDAVRILPGDEGLEVRYTGISFISPEQIKFKYKLEGLDHDWTPAGARRTAYYSHLPPGEYIFRVLAANRDGVWNVVGASVRIIVVPPFWRTWWFLFLELLMVAGIILLIYYRRVSHLQKAFAAQESFSRQLIASQERERERIAAELHDSLGQNLLIIKNRAFMGRSKIADRNAALAQLDEISAVASMSVEEVREIARNLRPYQLDRLGLTLALESVVEKIRTSSPIRFTADIDPLDGLLSPEAEINLYRIVQESINNIVKHSESTHASVRIKRDGRRLVVRIEDDGRGFATEQPQGGGFGLAGIRERARILGGTCSINSAPDEGTVIQIILNLPDGEQGGHNGRNGN